MPWLPDHCRPAATSSPTATSSAPARTPASAARRTFTIQSSHLGLRGPCTHGSGKEIASGTRSVVRLAISVRRRARAGRAMRNAWPRWLMAFFSSGRARPACGRRPPAPGSGRSRSRPCPARLAAEHAVAADRTRRAPAPSGVTSAAAQTKPAPRCSSGTSRQLGQQQLEVGPVVAVPPRPARGEDAGRAAEDVDGQPGVVGQRNEPGGGSDGPRLEQRVRGEGHARSRPTSSTSGKSATPTSSRSRSTSRPLAAASAPARIARSSTTLCALCVASTSRGAAHPAAPAHGPRQASASRCSAVSSAQPAGGQVQQLVEQRPVERLALGGALHLDVPAVAGHHDVHVGARRVTSST